MKKLLALFLVVFAAFALVSCGGSEEPAGPDLNAKSPGTMTYAEFMAAAVGDEIVIEGYVQDVLYFNPQWGNVSFFMADLDGSYYVYRLTATQELVDQLVIGAHIRVNSEKAEWAGEPETKQGTGTIDFLDDGLTYIQEAFDATSLFGTDDLAKHKNEKVIVKGLTVSGEGSRYKFDGSGQKGSDVYVTFTLGGVSYDFLVESDLRYTDTEVYQAAEALQVGDTVDIEGYLYWYDGPQIQMTSITASK